MLKKKKYRLYSKAEVLGYPKNRLHFADRARIAVDHIIYIKIELDKQPAGTINAEFKKKGTTLDEIEIEDKVIKYFEDSNDYTVKGEKIFKN